MAGKDDNAVDGLGGSSGRQPAEGKDRSFGVHGHFRFADRLEISKYP
jgi:hypothetical protein